MHRSLPPAAFCLALLLCVCFTPVARAACSASEPFANVVATASVVFVGTVLATTEEGRVARVRVDAVWRGFDLPAIVVVNGVYVPPGGAAPTPPPFPSPIPIGATPARDGGLTWLLLTGFLFAAVGLAMAVVRRR